MNITLFYDREHLNKAVAFNNSNNKELEETMCLKDVEDNLIEAITSNLEDLNVISFYGIFFIPEIISDLENYEDIGIIVHILVPISFEVSGVNDLVACTIGESLELH